MQNRGIQTARVTAKHWNLIGKWSEKFIAIMFLSTLIFAAYVPTVHAQPAGGPITGIAGKCLDNAYARKWRGNKIQLWDCNDNGGQQWRWEDDATIRNQGYCLDVQWSGKRAGTPVQLWDCNGTEAQRWVLGNNGSIVNPSSNLCLDDKYSYTHNGNDIWMYTCNGTGAQNWNITKAEPKPVGTQPTPPPVAPTSPPPSAPVVPPVAPGNKLHTPVPTITIDASKAPDLMIWLQRDIKPFIEQWYPILAEYYAYPYYTPPSKIHIIADPAYQGGALTEGDKITFNANYLRKQPEDARGLFIHEITHVIHSKLVWDVPFWIIEGMADYSREYIYKGREPRAATATETYLGGYGPASNLLRKAETLSPGFIRTLNEAASTGKYTDTMFQEKTGKTIAELWTGLTNQPITNPGRITNQGTDNCLYLPKSSTEDRTIVMLHKCIGKIGNDQSWVFAGRNNSAAIGMIQGSYGKCLDVANAGRENGTTVWYFTCNDSTAQRWVRLPSGALMNVGSSKCLQPVGGRIEPNSQLEINECSSIGAQKWSLPL
ncbi:MAG: putative secreted hydrolase [Candidatus Saccharibacteria bacterium]|nr:putative secreted hydrolase [Candidatus Saccharibacteria bacterium]